MKTIKMKYDIGTKIWVVYIHQGEVQVYADKIQSFVIEEDREFYYVETGCSELTQEEIILYEDKNKLYKVICEKMNEILESEEEDD